MTPSWEQCQTDGQTENGDFIGPSVGLDSKTIIENKWMSPQALPKYAN